MPPPMQFDRRMSDAEALMWRLDKDPFLSSTFGNLTVLDRAPDFDRLLRRLERATLLVPRLRQRVQASPANLAPPTWADDREFDLRYHVRRIALPAPGTMAQLLDLATVLVADPFERTRPLWEFTVVEGLEGGRAALVQKLHHTIIDGEGGVKLSLQFLDMERDAPEPAPVDPDLAATAATVSETPGEAVREVLGGLLRAPLTMLGQLKDLLANPTELPAAGKAAATTLRSLASQLNEVDPARSPLWTARTLRRRFEILQVPLADAKQAAQALGGTLNTLLLSAAADAAGAYHRGFDRPVAQLRASMAISTRTKQSGGNAFSLARLLVPTGEMDIADRFRAIHEATATARSEAAAASLDVLAGVAAALPTSMVTRLARQQTQTVDFATSNVKAAPFACYVAGSRITANHPIGPLGGVAFNLTLMSYDGSLDIGLHMDAGAVEDGARLVQELTASFGRLLAIS